MSLTPRIQASAPALLRALVVRLRSGDVPAFTSDGRRLSCCVLTAHFGQLRVGDTLVYGQGKKVYRRRRVVRSDPPYLSDRSDRARPDFSGNVVAWLLPYRAPTSRLAGAPTCPADSRRAPLPAKTSRGGGSVAWEYRDPGPSLRPDSAVLSPSTGQRPWLVRHWLDDPLHLSTIAIGTTPRWPRRFNQVFTLG